MSCPSRSIHSGQVQLNSSTATLIVPARPGRKKLRLTFGNGVFIGASGVTGSTGYFLSNPSTEIELETTDDLYGISSSGTPTVGFLETFD